ncbi:FKBP-type peptidyl-prolyl cis-trans isomerase [Gynuella sunshinyii]|uniref:Peptidyl-prolyl cis-trans isomerase n=1 Tax=Gynuella sunshinyii YC6258 TaxID=1445510 RepID=A0A0C5VDK6_9GAMM|nr:FKBP-type peptidyl-prolyl cis-trans isomerase [Gynuella sunshinyii]AJQ92271.1 FKBP-type peptidyl-prolyl cis-trans isomerases 1 [Gynuella sunshinyii YC6258]
MSKYSTNELKVSYGVGRQFGAQLKDNPFEGLDVNAVVEGVISAFQGQASDVNDEDMQVAFGVIRKRLEQEEAKKGTVAAEAGEAFLAENAKREEVTVTASGLQYEILSAGDGERPAASSTVRCHYHGTLIDGSVFDSSYQRGQPADFPVGGVIAGWTEALQMMPTGSKWRLYIPHQLGYGAQGAGGAIGPYQALVFDVELLEIL